MLICKSMLFSRKKKSQKEKKKQRNKGKKLHFIFEFLNFFLFVFFILILELGVLFVMNFILKMGIVICISHCMNTSYTSIHLFIFNIFYLSFSFVNYV